MIKYICQNCYGLECETSICPVCLKRTTFDKSIIYWSKKYNTPSFDEYCEISNERCVPICSYIRPVFPEERLLLEILLGEPMKYAGKSIWNAGSNIYIVDGKKMTIPYKKLIEENDSNEVIKKLIIYSDENKGYVNNYFEESYMKAFIEINKNRLNIITSEAINYIKKESEGWTVSQMFVSFSGGKDSTVTSDLVMKALDRKGIIHIYGDTTLEYPTSTKYVAEFRKNNPKTPLLIAKNKDQDFNNLCEVIGPPSRVMRWCCTIFKTGAITKKIENTFKGCTKLLTFQGIRRIESKSRGKYERTTTNSKIAKQITLSPIIDWLDFDVWLYIIANKLLFNEAYRQGFSRVGCWCCPNNSNWSAFLSSIYMNDEYKKFYSILYDFAKKVGKPDWKEYVDEGHWKARQGGNGLDYSNNAVISFKPCALEENAYNFNLTRPIDETLYTLFKPFGILDFNIGNKRLNEVYVLDRKNKQPIFKISGRLGKKELKVSVLTDYSRFKNKAICESLIKNQITKFQTCIGCSACESVCRFNALKVVNLEKGNVSNKTIQYTIDENKCVGCLECVKHFDNGCYMKKVLRTKSGE